MTTGYNVVDSCVLFFIFSFSSLLLVPPRCFFSLLRFVSFFPFVLTLCSFTFFLRDGKQRADFGSNDSGSVGPLHSMSRPDVYDLLFNAEYIIFSFSIRKSQMI